MAKNNLKLCGEAASDSTSPSPPVLPIQARNSLHPIEYQIPEKMQTFQRPIRGFSWEIFFRNNASHFRTMGCDFDSVAKNPPEPGKKGGIAGRNRPAERELRTGHDPDAPDSPRGQEWVAGTPVALPKSRLNSRTRLIPLEETQIHGRYPPFRSPRSNADIHGAGQNLPVQPLESPPPPGPDNCLRTHNRCFLHILLIYPE